MESHDRRDAFISCRDSGIEEVFKRPRRPRSGGLARRRCRHNHVAIAVTGLNGSEFVAAGRPRVLIA